MAAASQWKSWGQIAAASAAALGAAALSARMAWLAFKAVAQGRGDLAVTPAVISFAIALLAWGLAKRRRLAMRTAAVICLLATLPVLGAFTPFAVHDYREPPPIWVFFVIEAGLLGLAYFLDLSPGSVESEA